MRRDGLRRISPSCRTCYVALSDLFSVCFMTSTTARGGRRGRLPGSVSAWLRGCRLKAAWLALSFWPVAELGEGQKPKCPGSEERGRRGLGFATLDKVKKPNARAGEPHGSFLFCHRRLSSRRQRLGFSLLGVLFSQNQPCA